MEAMGNVERVKERRRDLKASSLSLLPPLCGELTLCPTPVGAAGGLF